MLRRLGFGRPGHTAAVQSPSESRRLLHAVHRGFARKDGAALRLLCVEAFESVRRLGLSVVATLLGERVGRDEAREAVAVREETLDGFGLEA